VDPWRVNAEVLVPRWEEPSLQAMAVPEVSASSRVRPASESWSSITIQCLSGGKACRAASRLIGSGRGMKPQDWEEPRLSELSSGITKGISAELASMMFNPASKCRVCGGHM